MLELEISSKKRRWEEIDVKEDFEKQSKLSKAVVDIELQLERPLPVEWQRCLDIKSGQIHFFNTRTQKRTSKDPRQSPERSSPSSNISLDLELNLTCESLRSRSQSQRDDNSTKSETGDGDLPHNNSNNSIIPPSKNSGSCYGRMAPITPPSWVSSESDEQEMVAAVCKRCHMLVMLCKSSPACPNCKFMHPPDQSPPNLLKPGFRLLCCKD
ncbi:PREDICTED: uncharacterized protein LOC104605984 [Nelumbo nucifera]|uniref:Uncharacterized protein LOC104605984 n=1 Tax=Nelumbo nucifera TaxID=4432 RepID=A0A1U8ASC0_NELNU|nr:PREDICTED: uncharacterized protein LOC104605984 [Nelumbo nucifera]